MNTYLKMTLICATSVVLNVDATHAQKFEHHTPPKRTAVDTTPQPYLPNGSPERGSWRKGLKGPYGRPYGPNSGSRFGRRGRPFETGRMRFFDHEMYQRPQPGIVGGSTRTNRFRLFDRNTPGNGGRLKNAMPGIVGGSTRTNRFRLFDRDTPGNGARLRSAIPKLANVMQVVGPVLNAVASASAGSSYSSSGINVNAERQRLLNALDEARRIRAMSKD